jgi:LysM repeat protein
MTNRPRLWVTALMIGGALLALSGCQRSKDDIVGRAAPTQAVAVAPSGSGTTPAPTEPGNLVVGVETATPLAPVSTPDTGLPTTVPDAAVPTAPTDGTLPTTAPEVATTAPDLGTAPTAAVPDASQPALVTTQEAASSGDANIATGGGLAGSDTAAQPGAGAQPPVVTEVPTPLPEPTVMIAVDTPAPDAGAPVIQPTVAPGAAPSLAPSTAGTTTYRVQPGDTLSGIAQRNNTTVEAIRAANNLTSNVIIVGQALQIPGAAPAAPTVAVPGGVPGGTYTVQRGDTLTGIAARYGTSVQAILAANPGIAPNTIYVGQQLRMPGAPAQPGATPVPPAPTAMPPAATMAPTTPGQQRTHVVAAGEWVYSIARKYGVNPADIIRANNLRPPSYPVYQGQQLIIP